MIESWIPRLIHRNEQTGVYDLMPVINQAGDAVSGNESFLFLMLEISFSI